MEDWAFSIPNQKNCERVLRACGQNILLSCSTISIPNGRCLEASLIPRKSFLMSGSHLALKCSPFLFSSGIISLTHPKSQDSSALGQDGSLAGIQCPPKALKQITKSHLRGMLKPAFKVAFTTASWLISI